MTLGLVWLRRDLRFYDHKPMFFAGNEHDKILPIFIFDTEILGYFSNPNDRRLSFLAKQLYLLNKEHNILVLHGKPAEIIPKLITACGASKVHAGRDFEPGTIARDNKVANITNCLELYDDHILINPERVLKDDGTPYKVYTPYSKMFRKVLNQADIDVYPPKLNKIINITDELKNKITAANLKIVELSSPKEILDQIGYVYKEDEIWQPEKARDKLHKWCDSKIIMYKDKRDFMDTEGTSQLSPYMRFGLISIRECFNLAANFDSSPGANTWINELIWREFYIAVLYHFPESEHTELQEQYRNLDWNKNQAMINAWKEGKTGYPIVDAAMRQLVKDGWMHNRSRMITASFFTKHLFADWRIGEAFFAEYLMDYELSSNVGGWQWSSSTGTDAQPYFRIFNPFIQSKKFDPKGDYIRKYVPELSNVKGDNIHEPLFGTYHKMIVEHDAARKNAIEKFKAIV